MKTLLVPTAALEALFNDRSTFALKEIAASYGAEKPEVADALNSAVSALPHLA